MVSPAQLTWIESALAQDTKANPPVPSFTIAQRAELRALMDAGHVNDVLIEIKYHSHIAFGRVMEKTMQASRELRQRAMAERLQKAQLVVLAKRMADKVPTPEPSAPPVVVDKAAQVRPLQRTAAQDNAIICEIKKQGYDPLALPKNQNGKPGVKAIIRAALSDNELFVGSTIFDKAWIRLAARADIMIQK
jgi:hypothetical protein